MTDKIQLFEQSSQEDDLAKLTKSATLCLVAGAPLIFAEG